MGILFSILLNEASYRNFDSGTFNESMKRDEMNSMELSIQHYLGKLCFACCLYIVRGYLKP